MENTLYVALTRQIGLRQQLDITANNLANANTQGYRADRLAFKDLVVATKHDGERVPIAFTEAINISRDPRESSLQITNNPLDIALRGRGFFSVQGAEGILYTRVGSLVVDAQNRLALADGNLLLDQGGQPIELPEQWEFLTVLDDGTIYTDEERIAQIAVVSFAEESALEKLDAQYYRSEQPTLPAPTTRVVQGAQEQSNVEAIRELVRLIDTERNYSTLARLIDQEDERTREAITQLSRI